MNLDQRDQQHAQKNEPSLDAGDAFSTVAPAAATPAAAPAPQPVLEAGDMPAWLAKPPAPPTAAQRWGRRIMFLGVAMLTVALAGGATLLGLDLYESHSAMEVVANSAQADMAARQAKPVAPANDLPFIEKRNANVPPLVLLPPDPNARKEQALAAPAAEVQPVVQPAAQPAVQPAVQPPVQPRPPVGAVPAPVQADAQPAAPAAATPEKAAAAKPKVAAVVKKPVPAVKRPPKPVIAKAKAPAKPVRGTMLQPPRDRFDNGSAQEERPAPRQAIDRRCRPGELARECEARTR